MSEHSWMALSEAKPHELSNQELEKFMHIAWKMTAGNMQTGNIYAALLSEKESRENKATVQRSLFLSMLAVSFALFSLVFSVLDWNGDKAWQDAQLNELKIQNDNLAQLVSEMNEAPNKSVQPSVVVPPL